MAKLKESQATLLASRFPDSATVIYIRRMVDLLSVFGISGAALLEDIGIEPGLLEVTDARVPKEIVAKAWNRTASLTGITNLGLKAAEFAPPGTFEILDHVAANQPNLEKAARATVRFYRLCDPNLDMQFELEESGARISCVFPSVPQSYSRHWPEAILALLVSRSRVLTARPDLVPLGVVFQHGSPANATEYQALFRCPLAFDAPRTEVQIALADLRLPVSGADGFLSRVLLEYAERALADLPNENSTRAFVRRSLYRRLARGEADLSGVAKEALCSSRTLQARLRAENTSFADLLDEVRRELALKYVANAHLRLVEIPLLLQFSEPSPFFRAFRRWTGITPAEYRRAACADGQSLLRLRSSSGQP
jgi:AraC-like DNA-binding protein